MRLFIPTNQPPMKFCTVCSNMYYLSCTNSTLSYNCRKCGNTEQQTPDMSSVIYTKHVKNVEHSFDSFINKFTVLDPTLPRTNTVLCPNAECATNTQDKPREIIRIRYDDTNMKYLYLCSECNTAWETNVN